MSYGRHQSFYLKKHWITKGINALTNYNDSILIDTNAFKSLGIGKNMHQSLRYWLETTNIVVFGDRKHVLSTFGKLVHMYDLGCDDNTTKLLLHYFLINNFPNKSDNSDAFIWFFNQYNENVFTKDFLVESLIHYNKGFTSSNTLNRDIDCLLNTYTNCQMSHPEDKNVSLLADLGLIRKKENGLYLKSTLSKDRYSLRAFIYILLYLKETGYEMSIEMLVKGEKSLGRAFNLNRVDIIEIIEKAKRINKFPIDITRTNNLDTVTIDSPVNSEVFLDKIFEEIKDGH